MSRLDGWRLRVAHETRFNYEAPARASYNELRLTPRTEVRQTALEARVVTSPAAAQYSYTDYWGTHVVAFNVDRSHDSLVVTSNALVDTQAAEEPEDCTWDDVSDAAHTMADHLSHSLYTSPGPELVELSEQLRTDRPLGTAHRVVAAAHRSLRYVRGVTTVHTSANEAFADGAGVCQDFAHLCLSLARGAGVPARYVSGYFHPDADATVGEEITGESHAWVEFWTGSWWGYDPTNDLPVGLRHVAVGRGRDYADVPPVKGIYAGNAENTMRVAVRIARTQ
jgi:transglutaminase-like putative cysteine protease